MFKKLITSAALTATLSLGAISAQAAPITLGQLNTALVSLETQLESIFGVNVDGTESLLTNIDFLSVIQVVDPASYLSIDNFSEQEDLLDATNNVITPLPASPIVSVFIVEAVNYCGGFNASLIGCADRPGHIMYLEGDDLLSAHGDELLAHELGHNLNLTHGGGNSNLMDPSVSNGNSDLTAAQLGIINVSPLIQRGTITIQPILISNVPLPPAAVLLGIPAILLTLRGRRRRA